MQTLTPTALALSDACAVYRRTLRETGCLYTSRADALALLDALAPSATRSAQCDALIDLDRECDAIHRITPYAPRTAHTVSLQSLRSLAPRPLLVAGVLRQGEVAMMVGATKSRKSWLALDLCLAISSGRTWLGCLSCSTAQTLYLDAECPPEAIAERVRILEGEGDSAASRVAYASARADAPATLLEATDRMRDLIATTRAHLVVVDTLSAYLPIVDENDNAEATRCISAVVAVAEQMQCAIMLVHHTPKQARGRSVVDSGAGAGAFARRVDTVIAVREEIDPETDEATDRHTMDVRSRTCASLPRITLGWRGMRAYHEGGSA